MTKSLFLILLLAAGLRIVGLTFDSLWLDEGYQTVVESYGNPLPDLFNSQAKPFLFREREPASSAEVLANFRKVDPLCPPLYALSINRWLTVFGGTDLSLRAFSAVVSCLSVAAIYAAGVSLFGLRAGIFAALLIAISPFDIAYAQEARMYSLMTLFSLISGFGLAMLLTRRQNAFTALWALVYVFGTWGTISTHYTGLFLSASEALAAFAFCIWRRDWLLFAWAASCNLLIGLLFLPWFGLFKEAAAIRTESFYVARHASLWWPFWALLIRIPYNWMVFLSGKMVALVAVPLYATAAAILFETGRAAWLQIRDRALGGNVTRERWILLLAWLVAPALAVWLIDVVESHRVVEITRYVIATAPALYLLAGAALANLPEAGRICFVPVSVRLFVATHAVFAILNSAYTHVVHQRENWREAAYVIAHKSDPQEIVFVSQYYDAVVLDRYLTKPIRQVGVSPSMGRQKFLSLIATLKPKSCWVVTGQEGDQIFAFMPDNSVVQENIDLGHAVHLKHYSLPD